MLFYFSFVIQESESFFSEEDYVGAMVYDPSRDQWSDIDYLPDDRSHACAAAVGPSGILLVGGKTESDGVSGRVFYLGVVDEGYWVDKKELPTPRVDHDCIEVT